MFLIGPLHMITTDDIDALTHIYGITGKMCDISAM